MPTEGQEWARQFPLGSSRIRAEARQDRLNWLDATGKPQLPEGQSVQIQPEALEKTYCPVELTAEEAERSCV